VRFENIGAEDIVDENPRMLGLIWTIILRFQIQEIEIDDYVDSGDSGGAGEQGLVSDCRPNMDRGHGAVGPHRGSGKLRVRDHDQEDFPQICQT